jgi:phosphoglycolate phosphatase-like HAD superfamily hydrolase
VGYKARYNTVLMRRVEERLARFRRGGLAVEDLVIKNAIPFLRRLHAAGATLYLASGTDQADLVAEANALGYGDLFGDRVFGAVGDVTHEAKRLVLDRIFRELDGHFDRVLVVGDGPVEMREGERRGAYTVGVASDEVRRYGLNPAKRARLIQAGAAAVIPDYADLERLVQFLHLSAAAPA